MASIVDLFNPTFLIFLGVLVLVVALLVVYFESKMRDQNHKIASVVSLVSTLADDMNSVKMGLNHMIMSGGQMLQNKYPNFNNNLGNVEVKKELIEVSDDEESDNEESDNEESDNEESDNEDFDNEDFEFTQVLSSKVKDGKFKVYSNNPCKVNWLVFGKRFDIKVEVHKDEVQVKGQGPYKWI